MEVASRAGNALGVAPALWVPLGKGQQLLWGATAAGSQQAAVPWHQGALELVLCGDRPQGDAQLWLCPTANAQQGLALPPGAVHTAHMDGHMFIWAPLGHRPTFLGIQDNYIWAHHSTLSSLAAAACPSTWHGLISPCSMLARAVLGAVCPTHICSSLGPAQHVYWAFSDTQADRKSVV